ncbi:MAG: hypothetical protein JW841_03500 [Deltaproteobacteria bacterium]|nr:hypothetical protein [Deltaproteobacteria bacterium]
MSRNNCPNKRTPYSHLRRYLGDPVDVVTGAVVDNDTDFRLPDADLPIEFIRYYDSRHANEERDLGWGYRHCYDLELRTDLDGMTFIDAQWQETNFPFLKNDGDEIENEGLILSRINHTQYTIRSPKGPSHHFTFVNFRRSATLTHISNGNKSISFKYNKSGKVTVIQASNYFKLQIDYIGRYIKSVSLHDRKKPNPQFLIQYSYDDKGHLIKGVDAYKSIFTYDYDAAHRLTRKTSRNNFSFLFKYDTDGRCIDTRGEDGAEATSFEYKPNERLTIVTRGDGGIWSYYYNDQNTIIHIIDPYNGVEQFKLDDNGLIIEEIDPNGNISHIEYDQHDQSLYKIDPLGYKISLPENIDDDHPLDHWEGIHPLEWELGEIYSLPEAMPTSLDLKHSIPPPLVPVFTSIDHPSGGKPVDICDVQGLPFRQENYDGRARSWGFDLEGNIRRYTDFDGRTTRYEHTSWNYETRKIDPLKRVTTSEYSYSEQLTAITDPGGTKSEYKYDLKDRLVEVLRHGRLRERYKYDAAGNVLEKHDGAGNLLISYTVAPGNLESGAKLASGGTYKLEYNDNGRIINAKTDAHTCNFDYDFTGFCIEDKRDEIGIEHHTILGAVIETKVLDKFITRYQRKSAVPTFDEETIESLRGIQANYHNILTITDPTGKAHRFKQLCPGVIEKQLNNGRIELVQYDHNGRCLAKSVYHKGAPRQAWRRHFGYSGEGDLLVVDDSIHGITRYTHDGAHRLASAKHPDGKEDIYEYDDGDNLLQAPGLKANYQSGNRLALANNDNFEYNERDHISKRQGLFGTINYQYDSLDQLIAIDGPDLTWRAKYDALGRRVQKTVNDKTWNYYWDNDRLAAEVFPNGQLRVYVYAGARSIVPLMFVDYEDINAAPDSGNCYYIFSDHRGAPEHIEDEDAAVVWQAKIDPYGLVHIDVGEDFYQPLRFPGHFFDAETGLHYNRFRYYSPELGRYLESDPDGITGGLNLYAYTNNPLTEVDVRGLGKKCPNSIRCRLKRLGAQLRRSIREKTHRQKPRRLTADELQVAADFLHRSMGDEIARKNRTTTITQGTRNGKTVFTITTSNGSIPRKMRNSARRLLGPNVEFASGPRGKQPGNTHHGEQRGIAATNDQTNRVQASSSDAGHGGAACDDCATAQNNAGVQNVTGTQQDGGRIR